MKNSEKPIQPITGQDGLPFKYENIFLDGITKREYFFAATIQGLCANGSKNSNSPEHIVELAIKITDEAMKILDKENNAGR